ncbi:MAG: DnaD domain-containing protein [Lachnospiraceae bacterium]
MNAFGIKGRGPARTEKEYIDRWTDTFHFTLDIIEEACNRTIAKTHSPSFAYADKILEDWSKKKVRHLNDIKPLDTEHAKTKVKNSPRRSLPTVSTISTSGITILTASKKNF